MAFPFPFRTYGLSDLYQSFRLPTLCPPSSRFARLHGPGGRRGQDFSGAIAKEVNFSGSDLRGVRFFKADLRKANFSGANLGTASLEEADLDG